MRIHNMNNQGDKSINKNKSPGEKNKAMHVSQHKPNELNFTKQLDDATEDNVKKSLDQLIEELSEQAQVLVKRRTFLELDKYKSLVRNFMKKTIEKIYTLKTSESAKNMTGRKKVLVMVDKVDEELEILTAQILNDQAESMDLLAVIDRIRGMLVDMYS